MPLLPRLPTPSPERVKNLSTPTFSPPSPPSAGVRLPIEALGTARGCLRGEGAGSRPPDLPSKRRGRLDRSCLVWPGWEAAGSGQERHRAGSAGARPGEGPPRTAARGGGEPAGCGRPGCLEGLSREDNYGREGGTCRARGQVLRPPFAPFPPFPSSPSLLALKMSVMLWRWEQNNTTMKLVRWLKPARGTPLYFTPTPPPLGMVSKAGKPLKCSPYSVFP